MENRKSQDNAPKQGSPSRPGQTGPSVSDDTKSADKESEIIKDKFLAIAKEKGYLESVIMQQNDMIKRLDKEKTTISQTLKKFAEDHRKMKEKLLDFDILRNMEISELKKKIDNLLGENKKLISEKDAMLMNLDRDRKNIALLDSRAAETKAGAGEAIEKRGGSPDSERVRSLEQELTFIRSQLAETGLELDETRAELYQTKAELDRLVTDKSRAEEELQGKTKEYSDEISQLKNDIDGLTAAIESKIHSIDELNAQVISLSTELSHKDSDLHDKVPALLDKINSLSRSIETKMEENSLFAKELFDLNEKISSLNAEILQKDEFLIEVAEGYKKQKEEIEALHGAHEMTLRNLVNERDFYRKELEALQSSQYFEQQDFAAAKKDRDELGERVIFMVGKIEELDQENADLRAQVADRESAVSSLQERAELGSKAEETIAEYMKNLSDLQEQMAELNGKLQEKDGMIESLQAERSDAAEKEQAIAELREEINRYQARLEEATAEHAKNLGDLQEQMAELNGKLQEKDGMIESLQAERSDAAEKEQAIAELREEINRYQARLEEATAEHAKNLGDLQEQMAMQNQRTLERNEQQTALSSDLARENDALASRVAEINKEKARLQDELSFLRLQVKESEQKSEESLAMQSEAQRHKAALEEDFMKAAEKINELAIELDHFASLNDRKDEALALADAEICRLKDETERQQEAIAELEQEIAAKEQASPRPDAEKEAILRSTREYEAVFEHLKEEIISLNRRLAEQEQSAGALMSEKDSLLSDLASLRSAAERAEAEMRRLETELAERTASGQTLEEEKNDLVQTVEELRSLNRRLAEQEQSAGTLLSEKDSLLGDLAALRSAAERTEAETRRLESALAERTAAEQTILEEKNSLIQTVAELRQEIKTTAASHEMDVRSLKDVLSTYGKDLADMQAKLEQSMDENASLQERLRKAEKGEGTTSEPVTAKVELPLPAPVSRGYEAPPKKHALAYTLLALLLLVLIGGSFYAYNSGRITLPGSGPDVRKTAAPELGYNEIYSLLTKTTTSGDIKFQATLLTEALLLKSDAPAEKSLYDFSRNMYFKVSIASPQKGLDKDIAEDPYRFVKIATTAGAWEPMPARVKEIKTFYRKEEPVSVTFYCTFPGNALTSGTSALNLSFNSGSRQAGLSWDIIQLRASSILH